MTLRTDAVDPFLELYDRASPAIREQAGCHGLRLYRDTRWPTVLTTVSSWESEEALDAYRDSELFRTTWAATSPLFSAPAQAWSQTVLREDPST